MTNTTETASPQMPLGISGFTYADLHTPDRLASLYDRFCEEVLAKDAPFFAEWDAYRRSPDGPRSPVALSSLLTRMAPYSQQLSRTAVRRGAGDLCGTRSDARSGPAVPVQGGLRAPPCPAVAQGWRTCSGISRRRGRSASDYRAGTGDAAPVTEHRTDASTGGHPAKEGHFGNLFSAVAGDPELALARAGCALLNREKTDKAAVADDMEALKRWCAAAIHNPAYREWVVFRFPENIEPWTLVPVQRPNAALPEQMVGPEGRLRRRDGFKLTDPRWKDREVLSEIHYCVLCHERDKDSCSKGFHEPARALPQRSRKSREPARYRAQRLSAGRENFRDARAPQAGRRDRRAGARRNRQPDVPGTGHRICNDCMKGCIYQKQEPVNIPQIETGVLTDVLEMPWGVEIYGLLTRWNPLNVRRPYALPYNGKNVLVVGLGPAGYTLAHYLVNEGFGVVGVDGLKIEPLPEPLDRHRGCPTAADSRLERDLSPSTSACSKASAACPSTASRCAGTRTS